MDSNTRELLLAAINRLAESIWCPRHYRFWYDNKGSGSNRFKFSYYCCQDKHNNKTDSKKRTVSQRDREGMERFECESSLVLQVDLGL